MGSCMGEEVGCLYPVHSVFDDVHLVRPSHAEDHLRWTVARVPSNNWDIL